MFFTYFYFAKTCSSVHLNSSCSHSQFFLKKKSTFGFTVKDTFSVYLWTLLYTAFHQSCDPASSLWPHHNRMACITAPFQTIRHSCCHLSLKGHCRILGGQTSRGFLTEGPSRWIKWADMPRKHLTYMKGTSGHMHYRALSRIVCENL